MSSPRQRPWQGEGYVHRLDRFFSVSDLFDRECEMRDKVTPRGAREQLDEGVRHLFAWVSAVNCTDGVTSYKPGKYAKTQQFRRIEKIKEISGWLTIIFALSLLLLICYEIYTDYKDCSRALDLRWVAPQLAIVATISGALYIGSLQLKARLYRDQVEHATRLADSAPDLIECLKGLNELCEHLRENARHYPSGAELGLNEKTTWGRLVKDFRCLAQHNPACLADLSGKLLTDPAHRERQENLRRLLAFFEKVALAIRHGYAHDEVLWERYNIAAIDCYVRATPLIIAAHLAHMKNTYLKDSELLGLPYEHYEIWLYWRTQDIVELNGLIVELREVRERLLADLLVS